MTKGKKDRRWQAVTLLVASFDALVQDFQMS